MENLSTKPCNTCAEEIRLAANKCRHCGVYQSGWRRKLNIGNSTLSLLIALVSVLTVGAPILGNVIQSMKYKKEYITASIVDNSPNGFKIYISNEGNGTGIIITRGYISMNVGNGRLAQYISIGSQNGDDSTLILRPGDKIIYRVGIREGGEIKKDYEKGQGSDCVFKYEIIGSDSRQYSKSLDFECLKLGG